MSAVPPRMRAALAVRHTLAVEADSRGPIPKTRAYQPVTALMQGGIGFSGLRLLHAIGCKSGSLPRSARDRCVRCAYVNAEFLDFGSRPLRYRRMPEQDFRAPRSQEIGVGVTCITASRCWSIDWDQLQAIPGRGKRFDYRGRSPLGRCIFESKGTSRRAAQAAQISNGLAKKRIHRRQGRADVELILSTSIGLAPETPRVLLADPPMDFDERAFARGVELYFRLRHFVRVLQFAGASETARLVYVYLTQALSPEGWIEPVGLPRPGEQFGTNDMDKLDVYRYRGATYLGTLVDSSTVRDELQHRGRRLDIDAMRGVRLFQGLREDTIRALNRNDWAYIKSLLIGPLMEEAPDSQATISTFPDGSILVVQDRE